MGKLYIKTETGVEAVGGGVGGGSGGTAGKPGKDGASITVKSVSESAADGGITKDVVAKSCPLYLPAGTYKLSGFVNNSGTNTVSATHSMWGHRVYDAETGNGIKGTTTSSNGANTAERTPCWDVGAGAVFTLSKPTYIYIDLWLPGNKDCSKLSTNPVLYKIG